MAHQEGNGSLSQFKFRDDPLSAGPKWRKWKRSFQIWMYGRQELVNNSLMKRARLLEKAGPEVQDVFFNAVGDIDITQQPMLVPGAAEAPDPYDQAIGILDEYFLPRSNEPYETEVFRGMTMVSNEPVDAFVSRLREQAARCNFPDIDREIRDQLLKAVPWPEVRKDCYKLALQRPLTLVDVQQEARLHQKVEQEQAALASATEAVNRLQVSSKKRQFNNKGNSCYRCGEKGHYAKDKNCPAWGKTCDSCGVRNHLAKACRDKNKGDKKGDEGKKGKKKNKVLHLQEESEDSSSEDSDEGTKNGEYNYLFLVASMEEDDDLVTVKVGGVELDMLVDSGSKKTNCIPVNTWEELKRKGIVCTSQKKEDHSVFNYGGEDPLKVKGHFIASVQTKAGKVLENVLFKVMDVKQHAVPIMSKVVATKLGFLRIDPEGKLCQIEEKKKEDAEKDPQKIQETKNNGIKDNPKKVDEEQVVTKEKVRLGFPGLFTNLLGKFNKYQVSIHADDTVKPVVCREPRLPLSRRKALEGCVAEMQKDGVVEVAEGPTTWVSRPHLVPKKKSGWRMVVDMRAVNAALLRERYPIPTREEMLCKIAGSKWFSSLDFKWCYLQFELKEDVRHFTTFVTHFGMFRFKRMAFGLSIAAEVCQRAMEELKKEALRDIPVEVKEELKTVLNKYNMCMEDCMVTFIDDWLIHAPTAWTHNRLLHAVLKTIQNRGMTLNLDKCIFGASSVEFVGCKISHEGYKPLEDSVSVVKNFREPVNKSEVHSFCGLATYFSIYVPEFANIITPLRKLLKKGAHFVWDQEQAEAFQKLKELIIAAPVLGFFKKNAPTYVFADASPVALGALIVQIQDGQPKVIRYAGYALSEVEKKYSQTEKEAYALVFACEKFQFYLLGTDFLLVTDHKPLLFIFKNGASSKTASLRVERWALRLQEYHFKIEYRAGKTNLADPLSRLLPLFSKQSTPRHVEKEEKIIARLVEEKIPKAMTVEQVLEETSGDKEIQGILECLRTGRWTPELKQYRPMEPLLMECQGLLLKEQKIVLPKTLWDQALKLAHEGHLGMTPMKKTLRLKVWWRGMDKSVEDFVAMCFGCQLVNKSFTPEPIVSTPLPAYAWEYVAVDFFEFDKKYLLALTDYYSRYVRIEITKDETAQTAVNVLEKIFIELSRPRKLASDNGPCFASKLFQDFLNDWGIVHVHKIRLWPQCNGEIERNNSNFVKRLQIAKGLKESWKSALYSYVYNYNVTPHSSTGVPPMQLLFTARPLLTKFPSLMEEIQEDDAVEEKDREAKFAAKKYADLRRRATPSTVQVGDIVLRKNEEKSSKTDPPRNPEPAIVVHRNGAEVTVQTPQGKTVQRNVSFFHPLKVCEDAPQGLGQDAEMSGQQAQVWEPGPGGPRRADTPRGGETPRQQGLAGTSMGTATSPVGGTAVTTSSSGRRSVGVSSENAKEGAEVNVPGTPKRPARERKKPCWMADYV